MLVMIIILCNVHVGAIPTQFTYYGKTGNVPFILSSPVCTGYEDSLFECVNMLNISFGDIDHYRGDPDHEINTAGVRCERKWLSYK